MSHGRGCCCVGRNYGCTRGWDTIVSWGGWVDHERGVSGSIHEELPKALSVFFNGWKEVTNEITYQIISLDEYIYSNKKWNHDELIIICGNKGSQNNVVENDKYV